MSMMMPPEAPPGLPLTPGGGDTPIPPMDAMSSTPLPAEGGIEGLIAALQGGGGAAPPGAEMPSEDMGEEPMDAVAHIQQAIKHLMMAMVSNDDEEQSAGIAKGLGPLQQLLGGEQKRQKMLATAGG